MAIYEDLELEQGSSFKYNITLKDDVGMPYDFAFHTLAGSMKKSYASTTIAATFQIVQTAIPGEIQMSLSDEDTATIKAGRYVFDILMETPSAEKYRVVEGQITVTPGVTTISA